MSTSDNPWIDFAKTRPEKGLVEWPVNTRLLTALKACRIKLAHGAEMVAMADVAIMGAEAAPRAARQIRDYSSLVVGAIVWVAVSWYLWI